MFSYFRVNNIGCGCAGWSAPLFFACNKVSVSRFEAHFLFLFQVSVSLYDIKLFMLLFINDPFLLNDSPVVHRGSYMSAHVLLNLLNKLRKRDKMQGMPRILTLFRNEFNKFNNTRAQMLDSFIT